MSAGSGTEYAQQVQLGAVRAAPLALVVFALGLVNCIGVSPLNNWVIALLQSSFVVYSALLFASGARFASRWGWGIGLIATPLLLSNLLASADVEAWKRLFEVLIQLCFGLAIAIWVIKFPAALRLIAGAALAAVTVYFLVLCAAWQALDDPAGYDWFYNPPLFRHIRHLGYFVCIASVIAAWALFTSKGVARALCGAVFCIAVGMLLWTGSRGAILALAAGLTLLAFHPQVRRDGPAWLIAVCAVLAALWLSAQFQVNHSGLGWLSAVQRSGEAESLNQLSTSRIAIWQYLIPKVQERFWFGWGGEGFKSVWHGYPLVQAHNGVLQLLIEWGAVGAAAIGAVLVAVFGIGLRAFFREARPMVATPALSLGVALTASLLALSLIDGVLYHGTPFAFLMVGVGLVLSVVRAGFKPARG